MLQAGSRLMTPKQNCPRCGETLALDAPAGHCPKCLVHLAMEVSLRRDIVLPNAPPKETVFAGSYCAKAARIAVRSNQRAIKI